LVSIPLGFNNSIGNVNADMSPTILCAVTTCRRSSHCDPWFYAKLSQSRSNVFSVVSPCRRFLRYQGSKLGGTWPITEPVLNEDSGKSYAGRLFLLTANNQTVAF